MGRLIWILLLLVSPVLAQDTYNGTPIIIDPGAIWANPDDISVHESRPLTLNPAVMLKAGNLLAWQEQDVWQAITAGPFLNNSSDGLKFSAPNLTIA